MKRNSSYILPLIIISQFAGTSLWFVGNAVLPELQQYLHLNQYAISQSTTAVQLGFILGTLLFAFLSLADRFSPAKIFFMCASTAAIVNVSIVWLAKDTDSLLILRFVTGFFLAGIYPVGMKIAADWYKTGLGTALGYLVGALVLGTAFPHLLKNKVFEFPWKTVLYCTSVFSFIGGLLMLLAGDGENRKKISKFQPQALIDIFRSKNFRSTAFGYFGHMWELYTFWGFLPAIIQLYVLKHNHELNIPFLSFLVIALGSLSCVAGGYWSKKIGSKKVAAYAMTVSGICCFLSPFIFSAPPFAFLFFLFIWGLAVIADSPQFSTLVAYTAPPQFKGTALTIVTSIGFGITVVSLIIIDRIFRSQSFFSGTNAFFLLGIGPLLGLISMIPLLRSNIKV